MALNNNNNNNGAVSEVVDLSGSEEFVTRSDLSVIDERKRKSKVIVDNTAIGGSKLVMVN